jgi:F-type H+-transporting ATPase subunit b
MQELLSQLGIDWQLLLSQAVNFLLLFIVLRIFVYKPLLKILHDRQTRIAEGITKAEEADKRLVEADAMKLGKIKEGETQAIAILKKTENDAKVLEAKLLAETHKRQEEEVANLAATLRVQEEESRRGMEREAAAMVRQAIVKTVELSPEKIDDALIARAVKEASVRA